MTRYTLHVPTELNDGTPVDLQAFQLIEDRLFDLADGFTMTTGMGAWRDPDTGTKYFEPMRLYHVDTDDDIRADIRHLADLIIVALAQVATYVTEQDITPHTITA